MPKLSLAQHKKIGKIVNVGCNWNYIWRWRLQCAHFRLSDDSRTIPGAHQLYLRSTMKHDFRNNCRFNLLSQKSIADTRDIVKIAKRFACAKEQHKGHFGKFEQDERRMTHPHVSKRSAAGPLNSNKYLTELLAVICHRSLKHCQIIFVNNLSEVSAQSISWPWPLLLTGNLTVSCFLLWFLSYHTGFRLALLSYSLIILCTEKERDVGNEGTLAGWY